VAFKVIFSDSGSDFALPMAGGKKVDVIAEDYDLKDPMAFHKRALGGEEAPQLDFEGGAKDHILHRYVDQKLGDITALDLVKVLVSFCFVWFRLVWCFWFCLAILYLSFGFRLVSFGFVWLRLP
jgi:hypothetical protein